MWESGDTRYSAFEDVSDEEGGYNPAKPAMWSVDPVVSSKFINTGMWDLEMSMVTRFFIGIECFATILNRKVEVSLNDQTINNLKSAKERIFDYFAWRHGSLDTFFPEPSSENWVSYNCASIATEMLSKGLLLFLLHFNLLLVSNGSRLPHGGLDHISIYIL